jgi:hypothetical protein
MYEARPLKISLIREKEGFYVLDCATSATFVSLKRGGLVMEASYREMEDVARRNYPQHKRIDVIGRWVGSSCAVICT